MGFVSFGRGKSYLSGFRDTVFSGLLLHTFLGKLCNLPCTVCVLLCVLCAVWDPPCLPRVVFAVCTTRFVSFPSLPVCLYRVGKEGNRSRSPSSIGTSSSNFQLQSADCAVSYPLPFIRTHHNTNLLLVGIRVYWQKRKIGIFRLYNQKAKI